MGEIGSFSTFCKSAYYHLTVIGYNQAPALEKLLRSSNYSGISELFYPEDRDQPESGTDPRFIAQLLKAVIYSHAGVLLANYHCRSLEATRECQDGHWLKQTKTSKKSIVTHVQKRIEACDWSAFNITIPQDAGAEGLANLFFLVDFRLDQGIGP